MLKSNGPKIDPCGTPYYISPCTVAIANFCPLFPITAYPT